MERMNNKLRKEIRNILNAGFVPDAHGILMEISEQKKNTLTTILNSLEFKNDILAAGGEIYAVGGIVRDAIMGKASDDLDIVVRGIPYPQLFSILSKYGTPTDTSHEKEDGKDFGSTKFVSFNDQFNQMLADNGISRDIDIMLPRKDSKEAGQKGHKSIKSEVSPYFTIYDDLKRRDITINAIALDLKGNIIDNGNSLSDIRNGIIRAVSEDSFIEDPLRMLRAIRFAARFNYKWDDTTLNLIKKNAHLLSDKKELPRDRFLMEFKKMIGKTDLSRAVKLLIELGLYKSIFGIEPKLFGASDIKQFDHASNVAEFSYMLFVNEPPETILPLVKENITIANDDLKYIEALVRYMGRGKNMDRVSTINQLAVIYNMSPEVLLTSYFIDGPDKEIARKFQNGELPKGEHDLDFKGDEFKNFIIDTITRSGKTFNQRMDMAKMGKAKKLIIQAVYGGAIPNKKESIKNYLLDNLDSWMN